MDLLIYLSPPAAEAWRWYHRTDEVGSVPPLPLSSDPQGLQIVLAEAEHNLEWLLMKPTGQDGAKPDEIALVVDPDWRWKVEALIEELRRALPIALSRGGIA